MKSGRIPGKVRHPHALVFGQRGKNRHAPGKYRCACGQEFTGQNNYERHRAEERKAAALTQAS